MPTATKRKARRRKRALGPASEVAVLGERTAVTRRLEAALEGDFQFHYHQSPQKVLTLVTKSPRASMARAMPSPVLYVVNFAGEKTAARRRAWFQALRALAARDPSTPVLITADQAGQRSLIERALQAGANEVIGAEESAIEELVRRRVMRILAHTGSFLVREPPFPGAAAPTEPPTATAAIGQAVEEADDALSPTERAEALERLRDAVGQLPDPERRRGPYLQHLLDVDVSHLRATESGRLDAKRIADYFGVSVRQLARATPLSHQALSANPDSANVQEALDPFARTAAILDEVLPADRRRQWLNAPHVKLERRSPLAVLLAGDGERVAHMLEIAREGGIGG